MSNNTERQAKLRAVQEADFFAHDLQLYLNTHPDCIRALELYSESVQTAKQLRNEYEKEYGPITAAASSSVPPWEWINSPWTWERSE